MKTWMYFLLSVPGVASAQPDLSPLQRPSRPMIEAARQHFASGTRFLEEGSWDAALVEFTASCLASATCFTAFLGRMRRRGALARRWTMRSGIFLRVAARKTRSERRSG